VIKYLSNGLKVRCHVYECIVEGANGDVVAIARCEGNMYQITFTEVCGADATNFVCSRAGGGPT
jgi:hypothetical protein